MGKLLDRLEKKARTEIRYARGMEVMQRERYLEYCHDLRRARLRGDFQRTRQIIQDLAAFIGETTALMRKRHAAYEQLQMLRARAPVPAEVLPDDTERQPLPGMITRLCVRTDPASDESAPVNVPPPQ